jgi:hypothetical protein
LHAEQIGKYFRRIAGAVETEVITYPDTFLGNLFSCSRCLGFWVSVLCAVLFFTFPYVLYPFAINAVSILIEEKLLWQEQMS